MTALAEPTRVILPLLHARQHQIVIEALRFNVLMCGRRFGKTILGEDRAISAAVRGHPVGWFAPTYKLLAEVWRDLLRVLQPVIIKKNELEHRVELQGGGAIECWTMDDPDPGRGRKYKRVILDEAGLVRDLEDRWQAAIRPTLVDLQGDAWFLGTPKGKRYFHQLFALGQSGELGWKSWRMGTADNPYLPGIVAELADARAQMPEAVYAQEYEGIPADDGGNPFGLDAISKCVGVLSTEPPLVWGWDLARAQDYTVGIALDAQMRVCRIERWQLPWATTKTNIREIVGTKVPGAFDATGVGDAIVEDLQNAGVNCHSYVFTQASKQSLMQRLVTVLQSQRVRIPEGVVRQELEAFEFEYTRTGVRYQAPQGLHDDAVCALALAVYMYDMLGYQYPAALPEKTVPLWDVVSRGYDPTNLIEYRQDRQRGAGQTFGEEDDHDLWVEDMRL